MARQEYFTNFDPSQSLGEAKTGDPWEKNTWPPAELGLSRMWPELGSNPQRWDDERFRVIKISGLNHSAMGAVNKQFRTGNFTIHLRTCNKNER